MGDKFQLTPAEMRSVSVTFSDGASDLTETIDRLNQAATTLADGWIGAGSEQFQADFADFKSECKKMIECLSERSIALNSSAQLADETQSALVSQWS